MYTDVHSLARVVGSFFLFIEKKKKSSLHNKEVYNEKEIFSPL